MPLFEWSEDFSVRVETFDNQHQELIKIINNLYDGMKSGKAKEILADILDKLIDYTIYHFKAEESLFDKHHYPEAKSHKQTHQSLIEKVKSLKKDHEEGKILVSVKTMEFLKDWLINHIQIEDKKYTGFFEKNLV